MRCCAHDNNNMSDSNDAAATVTPAAASAASNPTNGATPNDNGNNEHDPHPQHHASANVNMGRRLLSSSYRAFTPTEIGDRFVSFLLNNDRTRSALQSHVSMDHLAVIRQLGGDCGQMVNNLNNFGMIGEENAARSSPSSTGGGGDAGGAGAGGEERKKTCANASIEIDAFQLLSIDPVLGNLTLRYPDTLLELLEDSTVDARRVLRRRMEVALEASLVKMKRTKSDMSIKNEVYKKEVNNMTQLLKALRHTSEWYDPRPLHARLVHLPPHMQCCKPTLSSISSSDVGTVVQICGTCVRTGPVRMMEIVRTYKCLGRGCGHEFSVQADFGTTNNALPQPIVCPLSKMDCEEPCTSTSFAIVSSQSQHADYQEMKVQESASALNRVGSVPRSILIKLSHDLVDGCNPGDEVVVVGSLHAEWSNQSLGPDVEVMVGMSMRAHSVRVINVDDEFAGSGGGGGSTTMADLGLMNGNGMDAKAAMAASSGNLREKYRREFDIFWSDANGGGGEKQRRPVATRDYIVRAVCPKLYGMHAVKLGLLLVLIGGASVSSAGGKKGEAISLEDDEEEGGDDNAKPNEELQVYSDVDEEAPVAFDFGGGDDGVEDENGLVLQKKKKKRSNDGNSKKREKKSNAVSTVKARRRIQSHVLLIGDPGTGKSQFLRFAAALSPRSVLTTGTGSSTAGLTCAAVRDSSGGSKGGGNEFSLEAGALALADRGVCCIDEFGCMSKEDRTSIHEAMEQQTISVAKAGIICKLNARATVVAVMNPNGGLYDDQISLEQNSRLGSALLSRFDLIFVMLDQADNTRDLKIAKFLLSQSLYEHGQSMEMESENQPLKDNNDIDDNIMSGAHQWGMEKLRAYIATVRERFHPTLTPEASELLENHYSLCRHKQRQEGQSLVTVRFLESLIRLSQAHARLMYRDQVLLDDAVAVILLMECTANTLSGSFGGGGGGDDFVGKNPIDTEFPAFDEADFMFENEKKVLLQRYQGSSGPNNTGMPPQFNNDGISPTASCFGNNSRLHTWDDREAQHHQPSFARGGNGQGGGGNNEQRDQYGREIYSQATPAQKNNSNIGQVLETMNSRQWNPAPTHGDRCNTSGRKPPGNRVSFSQMPDNQGEMHPNTYRNDHNEYCNTETSSNGIHQYDAHASQSQQQPMFNSNGQFFEEAPQEEQERPRSDGFLRENYEVSTGEYTQECQEMRHGGNNTAPEGFHARTHNNKFGPGGQSNNNSSGKRRKKRRTAD